MRQIYVVNAVQVVVSEKHPEGLYSVITGFPKAFDSRDYNATELNPDGDPKRALEVAEAEYFKQRAEISLSNLRVMFGVTLERAGGDQLRHTQKGAIPATFPDSEEEPETDRTRSQNLNQSLSLSQNLNPKTETKGEET